MNDSEDNRAQPPAQERQVAIPVALLLPIVLAIAAGITVSVSSGGLPVPSFYSTSAQIIPILLVAFAVESRAVEFMNQPQARVYRTLLFSFLLIGELTALLGASGALREGGSIENGEFAIGSVAANGLSNILAGVTAAGLVGGFVMVAVVALGGPGWLLVSRANGAPPLRSTMSSTSPSTIDPLQSGSDQAT